ncbi:hypothetical protein Tco_0345050 [Tanacetum coccineum]
MSFDLFFFTSSDDEVEVNSELAFLRRPAVQLFKLQSKNPTKPCRQDRYSAHDRLVAAYFSEHPQFNKATFRKRFRMSRKLFTRIVQEITDHCPYFQLGGDCTRKVSIFLLMKFTSAIRQMTYGSVPDALAEYLQMGAATALTLLAFCTALMELYGNEYLRKPTYNDIEKL